MTRRPDDTATDLNASDTAEYPPAVIGRGENTVRIDEVKNFFSEQINGLKNHLDVEYRLLNTAIETHGQRIQLFWQQHDECFAANERARRDTRDEVAILRAELRDHIAGEPTEIMHHHRRREDSNEIKASFRMGRKLTSGRLIAASLLITAFGAVLYWAFRFMR